MLLENIKVEKFVFNGFQENTYMVYDKNRVAVLFDPGCYDRYEEEQLFAFIQDNNLSLKAILNTHAHIDHVLGIQAVMKKFQCDFYLHKEDVPVLESVANYASLYGFTGYKPAYAPTHLLHGGETLEFGEIKLKVIHAPGHAPGHVVYYAQNLNWVMNGDVLFKGSYGRTDLPGGNFDTLKKSIVKTMFALPDSTLVYCGHGPETTIGEEKRDNYILHS